MFFVVDSVFVVKSSVFAMKKLVKNEIKPPLVLGFASTLVVLSEYGFLSTGTISL